MTVVALNRLILISQLHRSGGTLFSQLLDGHSMIQAHPHELFIGKPEKWDWPDLAATLDSATDVFESLRENKIAALGQAGSFVKPGSNSAAKQQNVPFHYSIDVHRDLFCSRYHKAGWKTQRLAIQLYLDTFFEAWPEYSSSGSEKYVSCFLPHILVYQQSMHRMLRDFPDVLMVSLLRQPATWISSLVNHIGLDLADLGNVTAQLDRWKHSVETILELHAHPAIQCFATTYEALVQSPRNELERFCNVAGIPFEPILLRPTVSTMPVLPNSSYEQSSTGINTSSVDLRQPLPTSVAALIANTYQPLYQSACSALGVFSLQGGSTHVVATHSAGLQPSSPPVPSPKVDSAVIDIQKLSLFSRNKLAAATTSNTPFPYLVLTKLLPSEMMDSINRYYPDPESMSPMPGSRTGNTYAHKHRRMLTLSGEAIRNLSPAQQTFWSSFRDYVEGIGHDLLAALPAALPPQRTLTIPAEDLRVRVDLWSDRGGYQITPHTDAPHKLATFLLYCSSDPTLKEEGTSVFRPKDPALTCWSGKQWPLDQFEEVYRSPYAPNHLFGFRKTDRSFHGKLPVAESVSTRRTIAITLQTKQGFVK